MSIIIRKIKELEEINGLSKHEQLVEGIINAINIKGAAQGDRLPSVNAMVKELGFARKTIVKAYTELKDRGIVESKNRMGYFISNEDTHQVIKVALLMYAFHPFQEIFYNTFREALGENIQVDVFFHHSNINVFETILGNIKGHYGMYVIAPIPHVRISELLNDFPDEQLLLVDRYEAIHKDISHVTQEFEITTYEALVKLADRIKTYDEIVLFFKPNADYPIEVKRAFEKFIEDYNLNGTVESYYRPRTIKRGRVYFTIGDSDLWALLKDCKLRNWKLKEDIGVFSNNDSAVKEIVFGGITTLSTDFEQMAGTAAEFVLNRVPVQKIIPTRLIRRDSL